METPRSYITTPEQAQLLWAPFHLGFDHGYLLREPVSDNEDYMDGWAAGHDVWQIDHDKLPAD